LSSATAAAGRVHHPTIGRNELHGRGAIHTLFYRNWLAGINEKADAFWENMQLFNSSLTAPKQNFRRRSIKTSRGFRTPVLLANSQFAGRIPAKEKAKSSEGMSQTWQQVSQCVH
jgi:hypothetical protein